MTEEQFAKEAHALSRSTCGQLTFSDGLGSMCHWLMNHANGSVVAYHPFEDHPVVCWKRGGMVQPLPMNKLAIFQFLRS